MTWGKGNRRRSFWAAAIAMLVALAVPAAAAAHDHLINVQKVEKHVDLAGSVSNGRYIGTQHASVDISCDHGYTAVDGMWRVDHVDNNAQLGELGGPKDVVVKSAYPHLADPRSYHFDFNTGSFHMGRSQLKVFLVCVGSNTTDTNGHTHALNITPAVQDVGAGVGAGAVERTHPNPCPAGYLAVAPGFRFVAGHGRLFGSYPTNDHTSWKWKFLINSSEAGFHVYRKCLSKEVLTALGHRHNLHHAFLPSYEGAHRMLSLGNQEVQATCSEFGSQYSNYKAIVGGFRVHDHFHTWFLGMDPRPLTRAYRFHEDGESRQVWLGIHCLSDRTGSPF